MEITREIFLFFLFLLLEFLDSWRKISVEGLDDKKIWEFLDNQGHKGLTKNAPRLTVSFISMFTLVIIHSIISSTYQQNRDEEVVVLIQ
jgi:hypothetical protein